VFTVISRNMGTTPRSYVVTEFGTVNLEGKFVAEPAKAIIVLAHPDFREDLEWQEYGNRLTSRSVSFCLFLNPSDGLQTAQHLR